MKSNYAHKLNNANIVLGIHIAFKLVIILTLFIILYTTIWLKEIYLTIIKSSAYIQIFIFLVLAIVMLSINNPKSFDICSTFIYYSYLIVSILELGIIITEIYFLIHNLKNFITVFHECPYYRTYEEISEMEYKRTCLYYIADYNNELPYKYICYYNSENEYYNEFCDGFICAKNKNKNKINSYIKCFGNVDRNSIHFDSDNEFYMKEFELINRYKSSNLYACFRKEKIIKNENIFNNKCPDSNPIQKMIIFVYTDLILHLLVDFLFIYEFILIRKIKEIYSNLVLLQTRAPVNYLVNEEELRSENISNTNKQTFNTDNRELLQNPQILNTFNIQRENSQTIIIEPGSKNNNNINKIQENDNIINKNNNNQINHYTNIELNYNDDTKKETNENSGIINRKSKIFKNNKRKDYQNNNLNTNNDKNDMNNQLESINNINRKDTSKRMIIDVKKDEEYGINRITFYIRKKTRKKSGKKKKNIEHKNNLYNNSNKEMITLKTNINENNKDNIKIFDDKNFQKKNTHSKLNPKNTTQNNDNKNSEISHNKNNILNKINDDNKNSIVINNKNNNKIKLRTKFLNNDIKSNSNIIEQNYNKYNIAFKNKLLENNVFPNDFKNNSQDNIFISLNKKIINSINMNNNFNKQFNKEKLDKKKNKIITNSTKIKEKKEDEKEKKDNDKNNILINNNIKLINNENYYNKDNKSDKKKLLDNIHINSEIFLTDEELEKKEQNKFVVKK